MTRAVGMLTVLCCLAAGARAGEPFDDLGTLVEGTECVLFHSDRGPVYVVENQGDFTAGDYVRVMGDLSQSCYSACMEGEGCVLNNEIYPGEDYIARCGQLVSRNGCAVLEGDDGSTYALDESFPFQVGDYVHVVGTYYSECGGSCAQGLECIRLNTIYEGWRFCDGGAVQPDDPQDPLDEPDGYEPSPDAPLDPGVAPTTDPESESFGTLALGVALCGGVTFQLMLVGCVGISVIRRVVQLLNRPA